MSHVSKMIESADDKINFGKITKRYFQAREDYIQSTEDEHDFTRHELELHENKVKNSLFNLWKDGKIVIKFD